MGEVLQALPLARVGINDQLRQSPLSETAYYLIALETAPAPVGLHELFEATLGSVRRQGGGLVDQHALFVCLLERRELRGTLPSWSITRLPGTLFTDYVGAAEVLARDLIYEAGHHWFNYALATAAVLLPDDVTFYSPWRETTCPVFGFLHACWAFSLTAIYSASALDGAPPPARAFLDGYLTEQGRFLRAAVLDFAKAATLITSTPVRERVSWAMDAALQCTPRPQ
ncbi:HEXXH motif-containing putative peptide modification protein [Kitasatospora sp. NPDC056138]|uniref:aKG-HExxH-type peptide beta-hydroxylase n=1 Tax=Kitasatospora sp. NPDC056138 TaxID=3345724 RepID=UPI0035DBCB5A